VLGRELFDKAFRDYAQRWRFKGPTPYDFFRTMEESSGVDLDWFWRGWFYSTDHVDIALERVTASKLAPADADAAAGRRRADIAAEPPSLTASRNTDPTVVERDPRVRDYYDQTDRTAATAGERRRAATALADLTTEERAARTLPDTFYRFDFRNVGGLVMPVILKLDFTDGTTETVRIPAEVWRRNSEQVSWRYVTPKTLRRAEVDPLWETADADRGNNTFEGGLPVRTLRVTGPETPAAGSDRLRDDDLKVSPESLQTYPATRRPTGDGPDAPSAVGVTPPPATAPAVPRGEPGTPPSNPAPEPGTPPPTAAPAPASSGGRS
jgi:aminopeptidase N